MALLINCSIRLDLETTLQHKYMPLSDDFEIKCPNLDYNDDQLSKTVKFSAFKLPDYPTGINSPITREQTCLPVQKIHQKHSSDMKVVLLVDNTLILGTTSYIIGSKDVTTVLLPYTEQVNLLEYILSQITAKITFATTERLDGPQWEVKVQEIVTKLLQTFQRLSFFTFVLVYVNTTPNTKVQ